MCRYIVLIVVPFILLGCYKPSIEEGRRILFVADSLENAGYIYNDSCRIKKAVDILKPYRFSLINDYAKAEYHYGNMLFSLGYTIKAKEAFIRAVDSGIQDKQIAGKIQTRLIECQDVIIPKKSNPWFILLIGLLCFILLILLLYEYAQYTYKDKIIKYYQGIAKESVALKTQTEQIRHQQYIQKLTQAQYIQQNIHNLEVSSDILSDLHWDNYEMLINTINMNFNQLVNRLNGNFVLTEKDIRLCVLVFLDFYSDKQMADLLFYSYKSIRSIKRKVANKLGTTSANLRNFLMNLTVQ